MQHFLLNSWYIASAAVVTDIHAIAAPSTISQYLPNRFQNITLKVGPTSISIKTDHHIADIRTHPCYSNEEENLYADIAVVFVSKQQYSRHKTWINYIFFDFERRKIDIQLCYKHIIYLVIISRY